ncbi:hypothetical protein [Bradyrhizobium hereditatis]|uniref:hypothetical protein n=1 Tax=Bradyrhizobium hereditatis TaxID=2821405 RepID=UPI001CE2AB88|nr:hypothetical protein [Bradyrhizobium hereditatis]
MTLQRCADCGREISDRAMACPGCGRLRQERGAAIAASGEWVAPPPYFYEYKSQTILFGLPLIHVMLGPTWLIGFRPARGIIAVGNIAIGFVAFGGVAVGLAAFGGISLGLACVGGLALALGLGAGGIATGYWALGGIAVGVYAIGGLGIGAYTLQDDPNLLRILGAPSAGDRASSSSPAGGHKPESRCVAAAHRGDSKLAGKRIGATRNASAPANICCVACRYSSPRVALPGQSAGNVDPDAPHYGAGSRGAIRGSGSPGKKDYS